MSAAAALAGFLAGSPLVYVDYGQYHVANRIPVAGTEYPRLLGNPLEVFGDLELAEIFRAFNRSDFVEAEHLAERLAERLYEPREAEVLALLSRGYGAWDRFDFVNAERTLDDARERLARFSPRGRWAWAESALSVLAGSAVVLGQLARLNDRPTRLEAGVPLVLWYLAAAQRLLAADKPSLAVLLTYAALERYVDLCLWVDFGLSDEKPDYSLIADRLNLERYDQAGRALFGKEYERRGLSGPLMFGNGAQLLAALDESRLTIADLPPLRGLSVARNKCEYEHGLVPRAPGKDDVVRFWRTAVAIVSRACAEPVEAQLERYRFPVLGFDDGKRERAPRSAAH